MAGNFCHGAEEKWTSTHGLYVLVSQILDLPGRACRSSCDNLLCELISLIQDRKLSHLVFTHKINIPSFQLSHLGRQFVLHDVAGNFCHGAEEKWTSTQLGVAVLIVHVTPKSLISVTIVPAILKNKKSDDL